MPISVRFNLSAWANCISLARVCNKGVASSTTSGSAWQAAKKRITRRLVIFFHSYHTLLKPGNFSQIFSALIPTQIPPDSVQITLFGNSYSFSAKVSIFSKTNPEVSAWLVISRFTNSFLLS